MSFQTLVKTSVVCVFLVFFHANSTAQLRAGFSSNVTSGCAPIVVQFTDESTGNPNFWKWDLGNGTISFLQNPSATYFTPGNYTVKLLVQDANGQDSITQVQYIHVFAKPTIDFSSSVTTGCFPLPVQFNDLSLANSGTIVQWQWDFGDGISSTLQNPSHTYQSGGNFNISLRVTNSEGCVNTITRPNFIRISQGVTAGFTHSNPANCNFPVNIEFQNTSRGTGNLAYTWNFGDGTTSTEETPSHNYNSTGSFTVSLIVANSTGCRDTIIQSDAIVIGAVDADFTVPATVCVNTPFTFGNTSSPSGVDAFWDFGDGTTSTAINPSKTYTVAGSYVVTLISNSGGCADTVRKNITVMPQPAAGFTANPVQSCRVPVNVTFTNTSSNALTYSWSFGDGTTSTDPNPTHQYTSEGNFTVTLISTNASGCSDTLVQQQMIDISLPQAAINNLPQEGCAPLEWTFESTVNSTDSVVGYWWNFGDGTTSTEQTPTHSFTEGIYDITLAITTLAGCTDTVTVSQGIKTGNKPVANFSADPLQTCAWRSIKFTDLTTDTADTWLWEFGDGGTSALQNPEYKYKDTGYFTVKLIVWNLGCSDTLEIENFVYIDPPIAKMRIDFDCLTPMTRTFTDKSVGADRWLWSFGDGNTSTAANPVHTYLTPGSFRVTLVAFNNTTGCSDTTSRTIQVMDEQALFNVSDTVVCRNTPVTFTGLANRTFISGFFWDFGDGQTGSGSPVSHTYRNPGTYTVSLFIKTVDGCRDTLVKSNYITVNGPTAAFGSTVPGSCKMSPIAFLDSSVSDGIHAITSWTWNYGDGATETLNSSPFIHTYLTPGNFTVALTVTDTEGCKDSVSRNNLITISNPRAAFSSPDSLTCPGRTIRFTSHASGPQLQHFWNFGDGNTSTQRNPTHEYAADGNYDITLVVIDMYGCRDSITKPAYIKIVTPNVQFAVSDTLGTCPPLVANFTNQSTNYITMVWDFGDGTSTTQQNPSHFYATPGHYVSSLTLTGPGGCTSVKTQNIEVRGPQGTFTYRETVGCEPLSVTFRAVTRDRVSFIWDFNDGNTQSTLDSVVTHTYTTPGFYIPKMILIDAGGCVVPIRGTDTIWVKGVNVVFDMNQVQFCDSGAVRFNNTSTGTEPFASYLWTFGDGNTSDQPSPRHNFTQPGVYFPKLKVTTISGCSKEMISPVPVKIVASPKAVFAQSANGCTPLTATFSGSLSVPDTSALTWRWNFGNGQTSDLQNPASQQYTTAGTYNINLYVTNSSGCIDTVTSTIQSYRIPVVSAGDDMFVCEGTGKAITATGAATYSWSPATGLSCADCPSPIANPTIDMTYTVVGTSDEGCSSSDVVNVSLQRPFHMTSVRGDSICAGGSRKLSASGAHSYTWSPSAGLNNPNIAEPIASPLITTRYMVVGKDDKNCFTDTAYVPVRVFPIPTVEAGEDKTINVGTTIDLVPVVSADVTRVTWSPTGSIFRNDYPAITVKPRETTEYTVDVTNAGGCMARDRLRVTVLCNDANVFIPNTFSPNNDGANDVFYPRGRGLFSIKSMKVFNRWGEIVYQKNDFMPNDVNAGWNGTYKGKPLSPDVYVYIIEVMCDNSTVLPLKGNVALLK